jgi:hypothetical protein
VHRRNQNIGRSSTISSSGSATRCFWKGAPEDVQRLAADMELVDVSRNPPSGPIRRGHRPSPSPPWPGSWRSRRSNVAPILALAVVAVAVVLLTGCIDADEAFSFIDGRLLALIFAMLAIGAALESLRRRGADRRRPRARARGSCRPSSWSGRSTFMTSVLTELVSNNAVAVVMSRRSPSALAEAPASTRARW